MTPERRTAAERLQARISLQEDGERVYHHSPPAVKDYRISPINACIEKTERRTSRLMVGLVAGTGFALGVFTIFASAAQAGTYGADQQVMEEARYIYDEPEPIPQAVLPVTLIEPAAGEVRNVKSFQGPYLGGQIGYNTGSYDVETSGGPPNGDAGLDGVEGGVFAGYGYVFDQPGYPFYLGIEGGYEWSSAEGDIGATTFDKSHEWLATVRPGVVVNEETLLYGIIGYSRADFAADTGADEDYHGLVAGAGAEFGLGIPYINLRGEYSYTNYEDDMINGSKFDGHENEIKLGLLLRF